MKKVLLAGASGYLGRHIANELRKQQKSTKVVVRSPQYKPLSAQYSESVVAEVTQPGSLIGIMNDVDTVISTIGITRQKDGLTYMDVDYKANLNLLREAKKSGVQKFIYVSALNADKLKHLKMCRAKERFVQELQNSGLKYSIIRPNGFFSDMGEFLKMAKKGKVELFAGGNYRMNPIHGADLAEVCVKAIHSTETTIEVGGPEVFTHKQIAELAFNTINKKAKISYMPEWIRKMMLWSARAFTSSKTYGPLEFFLTVLSMDMIAPRYGSRTLSNYFRSSA